MARSPFRRLLGPGPDEVDAAGLAAHLRDREVLALNMVVSVDGHATLQGSSRPLSTPADHELFLALRRACDRVMVGRTTADAEGYASTRRPAVVITRADRDLPARVAALRGDGVRSILCEGGPTLNALLLRARLVDELLVTLAPRLAGGEDPLTMVHGQLEHPLDVDLLTLHESGGALFARYAVTGDG